MRSVILYYGPYEAWGSLKYRTQRLHGLLNALSQRDYEVEIIPFPHLNRLSIEMAGSIIYQCDIRNLLFNIDYEDDVVCRRIVAIIEEADSRINAAGNILKFYSTKHPRRYVDISKNVATQDFFESYIDLIYEHQEHLRSIDKNQITLKVPSYEHSCRKTSIKMSKNKADNEYAISDFAYSIIRDIVKRCNSEICTSDKGSDDSYYDYL
ncbi:hypothetical protein MML48_1g13462 [Holotrichia oblita]|uniref:Uncharacterized protein n=1 Tax=Holotrichia oblita TaxID=644536 RepID=A0ACB9TU36_HOLOL|nr:hypothetical protein MML48_1g13462 [Holotrichia oblita]